MGEDEYVRKRVEFKDEDWVTPDKLNNIALTPEQKKFWVFVLKRLVARSNAITDTVKSLRYKASEVAVDKFPHLAVKRISNEEMLDILKKRMENQDSRNRW